MTFHGSQLRQVMPSYCSRGRFLICHRLKKLIGLGVQIHRDTVHLTTLVIIVKKVRKFITFLTNLQNPCPMFITMIVHVLTQNTMKPRASITDTFKKGLFEINERGFTTTVKQIAWLFGLSLIFGGNGMVSVIVTNL